MRILLLLIATTLLIGPPTEAYSQRVKITYQKGEVDAHWDHIHMTIAK